MKKEAPEIFCNNTISFDNPTRQRIYELFLSGNQYTVVQLSILLKVPDVRSHIRYIRNRGVLISDYWKKSEYSKYKVYFLSKIGGMK